MLKNRTKVYHIQCVQQYMLPCHQEESVWMALWTDSVSSHILDALKHTIYSHTLKKASKLFC